MDVDSSNDEKHEQKVFPLKGYVFDSRGSDYDVNEFQKVIFLTGATNASVKKVIFGLLSDNTIKSAIEKPVVFNTKQNIGTVDDTYYTYFDDETETVYIVPASENINKFVLNENCYHMFGDFRYCEEIKGLDLWDTSSVKNMREMFFYCFALKSLDLSKFNTSKVTDMGLMFSGCHNLEVPDFSQFDTSNVTDMCWMFSACRAMEKLDLCIFDTSKVTNMNNMFNSCRKLTTLDLSSFDTSNVTDMNRMFLDCGNLATIYVHDPDTFIPESFDVNNITFGKSLVKK